MKFSSATETLFLFLTLFSIFSNINLFHFFHHSQRERSLSRFRGEQRDLGVDISSDEEGNNWDESLDKGLQHPPLKKLRTNEEGNIVSNKKIVPRDKEGIVNEEVSIDFEFSLEDCKRIMMIVYYPCI